MTENFSFLTEHLAALMHHRGGAAQSAASSPEVGVIANMIQIKELIGSH
jgi:hypothetical protein